MTLPRTVACLLALLTLTAAVRPASAMWPHDPNNGNVPVSTAAGPQENPVSVPDGAGGVIIAWQDLRGGVARDVYAQRLNAAGVPLWTANGVALCTAVGEQNTVVIVSDGAGGAIVSWNDARAGSGSSDLYAQRVDASGTPLWTTNGVAVSVAANNQFYPAIATDGAGGAIIAWYDNRNLSSYDIYAQRLNAAGAAVWTANGVPVCAAALDQYVPTIASDGAGGAFVAWYDYRTGANYDIWAQRLNSAGVAQWTANGINLCNAGDSQYTPVALADGAGGAIIAWMDARSTVAYDIYAQRVSAAGAAQWTANGVAVCVASGSQYYPTLCTDGSGGAVISWQDGRSGPYDIYSQRISGAGFAQWTSNGVAVCAVTGDQFFPMTVSDDVGGAIVSWFDRRNGIGTGDIFAQRITAGGTQTWTANGAAVCTAVGEQSTVAASGDGAGGAILAWADLRNGSVSDLYAQRIDRFGYLGSAEPVISSVKDVRNDQGGRVKLAWAASYLDTDPLYGVFDYRLWRSVPQAALRARPADAARSTHDSDQAAVDGSMLLTTVAGNDYAWELVSTQSAAILPSYSVTTTTTSDSIAESNPATVFMVEARASTALSAARWFSAPDSGYSVDNLPPAAPAPFTGSYAGGATSLHWLRNSEADLAGYRLYRGTDAGFVTGPGNLLSAQADTGYVDPAGATYFYKLTAVDSHGNESPVATLAPGGTLGVEGGAIAALSFALPNPNPARGSTSLRYTLSRAGRVRLAVYDAAGRRVQVLHDGEQAAGLHERSVALHDEAGRALPAGLYLLRLEAEGRVLTRRLATVR